MKKYNNLHFVENLSETVCTTQRKCAFNLWISSFSIKL